MQHPPNDLFRSLGTSAATWTAIFAALAFLGCEGAASRSTAMLASDAASPNQSVQINIQDFSFSPATLTVPPGATVTWINHDDMVHTVVDTEGKFKSDILDAGDRFSFTFGDRGTFSYFCGVHPHMTGKIVIQ